VIVGDDRSGEIDVLPRDGSPLQGACPCVAPSTHRDGTLSELEVAMRGSVMPVLTLPASVMPVLTPPASVMPLLTRPAS
jgi:hypothetical protein